MKKLLAIILIVALLLPFSAFADDSVNDELCGRWCFYWDTRPMNETYNNGKPMMSFLVSNYDFYIYEDGTMSFVSSMVNTDGSFSLNYPAVDGLWIATDADHITIRTMNRTLPARLDASGRLLVYFVEDIPYPFIKVPSYDYFAETSK